MRAWVVVLVSLVALGGNAVQAELPESSRSASLLGDVIRMLEGGVEPTLVLDWLSGQGSLPAPISADDLVRLKQAGASEALIRRLLELGRAGSASTKAAGGQAAAAADRAEGDQVKVGFTMKFRPYADVEEEVWEDWDLYAYLDGQLLAWARSSRKPIEFSRRLVPGPHAIRLLLERHEKSGTEPVAWRHQSRVCPDVVAFELAAGDNWSFELFWVEPQLDFSRNKGPLSWRLLHDGELEAGQERVGTPKQEWPRLCEDLEASVPEGKKPARWVRQALERCVRWTDLWEPRDVPSRAQVRNLLQPYDFKPPVLAWGMQGSGSD